jgi:hypothetical protein
MSTSCGCGGDSVRRVADDEIIELRWGAVQRTGDSGHDNEREQQTIPRHEDPLGGKHVLNARHSS